VGEQANRHRPAASPADTATSRSEGLAARVQIPGPATAAAMAVHPEASVLIQLAEAIDRGPRVAGLRALGEDINGSPRVAQLRLREAGRMGDQALRPFAATAGPETGPGGPGAAENAGAVVQGVFNTAFLTAVYGGQDDDIVTEGFESAELAEWSLDLHHGETEDFAIEEEPRQSGDAEFQGEHRKSEDAEMEEEKRDSEHSARDGTSVEFETEPVLSGPPGAYIVNAILPYTDVGDIPKVIAAMVEGLRHGPAGHVAVVLGINAPIAKAQELKAAMARAEQIVEGIPFPVALVESTFSTSAFPFGTMRNEVLHSPETRMLTSYFVGSGYHPYISFQDFDTGSRRVGSDQGPHVFDAVDDLLAGLPGESDESGMVDPIRPLMIAGGYRPGRQEDLVEATWARVQQAQAKPKPTDAPPGKRSKRDPLEGLTRKDVEQRLEKFPDLIEEDMQARDDYARLDPLLPYSPEPNLFVDATAAALPSPVSGTRLEFGPGGAEFTALGKALALYAAEELGSHYERQLPPDFQPSDLQARSLLKPDELTPHTDAVDLLARLQVDAQTNRHPIRGKSFLTDFQNLSTATDLSRLALGHVQGKAPQSHTGLGQVTDRFFNDKTSKAGASFAGIRDDFNAKKRPAEFLNDLYVREGGAQKPESTRYFRAKTKSLGGARGQTMSGALQQPFPGAFSGFHFGTSPEQAIYLGHQLALQRTARERWEEARRQEAQAMRQSVQDEAVRIGVSHHYTIGHADGTDHNCTIISIFAAAGIPISREQAMVYRQRLWRLAPEAGLSGDVTLTANVARHILAFVNERNGGHYQLSALQEAPQQGGQPSYVAAAVAGQGSPIFIFFAGAHFSPAWPK
jgi:hypothetical protein